MERLKEQYKNLDTKESLCPCDIPARIIDEIKEETFIPLLKFFNTSIKAGILPIDWKSVNVTLISKKGNENEATGK